MIVVIARDRTKQHQKKTIIFNEQERLKLIQSLKIVDEVILGHQQDHFQVIREKKPDVICLGYDHTITEQEIREKLQDDGLFPQIVRTLPFNPGSQKSSILRQLIQDRK